MESDVSVSDLVQYAYCPRKVYFSKVLGLGVVSRRKMDFGKKEHEREHRRSKERKMVYGFDRKDVKKVIHSVYVEHEEIGLYGQVDTVLEFEDGSLVPVEVKYSDFATVFKNWRKQLVAYGLLLEEKFGKKVEKGVLYFPKQKERIDVDITIEDKEFLIRDIERIRSLVRSEKMPRGRNRCGYCEMRKFCKE
jgi:CRISPR-associated exonuclease Cas4